MNEAYPTRKLLVIPPAERILDSSLAANGTAGLQIRPGIDIDRAHDDIFPLNYLDFQNTSAVDVEVRLDGNILKRFIVPAGEAVTLDPDDHIWYSSIAIVNRSGTTAAAANTLIAVMGRLLPVGEKVR